MELLELLNSPADWSSTGLGFVLAVQGGDLLLQRTALRLQAMIKISALVLGGSNEESKEFKHNSLASFTFELTK